MGCSPTQKIVSIHLIYPKLYPSPFRPEAAGPCCWRLWGGLCVLCVAVALSKDEATLRQRAKRIGMVWTTQDETI